MTRQQTQDKAGDNRQGSTQKTRQETKDKAADKRHGRRQKTRQPTKEKAVDKREGSRDKTRQGSKHNKTRDDKTRHTEGRLCSFDVGGGRARRWSYDVLQRKIRKDKHKRRQGSRQDKTRQDKDMTYRRPAVLVGRARWSCPVVVVRRAA